MPSRSLQHVGVYLEAKYHIESPTHDAPFLGALVLTQQKNLP
jgi:hypothetical protein